MASQPLQAILNKTQAYVDPLIGSKIGAFTFVARMGEGRFGTLYRGEDAQHAPVTLQVLRTELTGNAHEVGAVNTLKCAGVAKVTGFHVLPDGRHVRVMEFLDGRSLEDDLHLKGRFASPEVIDVLAKLLDVLQTTHTWHVVHGRLGPSSVVRVGDQLKLIDFGLAREAATPADDLKAVGALGFTLLAGKELDGPPPKLNDATPERLHRLLIELLEGRTASVASARRELDWLRPAASARKPRRFAVLALVVIAIAGGAFWFTQRDEPAVETPPEPPPVALPEPVDAGAVALVQDALDAGAPVAVADEPPPREPPRKKPPREVTPRLGPAPTAVALEKQMRVFEVKLRKKKLQPGDVEEALHVLNKQRLRLSGSVTEDDRRDIATRLAAWKRVWLQ